MNTTLDGQPSAGTELSLVMKALKDARDLPRFYGLVRGLEIGISTLSERDGREQTIENLQSRFVRLTELSDQYHVGVALGIDLTIDLTRLTLRPPMAV